MNRMVVVLVPVLMALGCSGSVEEDRRPDAAQDADPVCYELMALRVCSNLEIGPHCPTTVCDGIEWYRCPPGQTEPLEPQQEGDCRWGKGSVGP